MVGRLFSSAICAARKAFFTVQGLEAPPFTVGSLAETMHSTPSTTPMPVTSDAPTVKSEPQPASGDSSRKADPGSTSSSIRSRAVSLPRAWWRSTYFSPPPATATACCSVEVGDLLEHRLAVAGHDSSTAFIRSSVVRMPFWLVRRRNGPSTSQ